MGGKQVILRLRKEGKSFRAIGQTMGIASTTICNVLKKKETIGVLSNRGQTGRPSNTTEVNGRKIVRAAKISISAITNNLSAGVKVSPLISRKKSEGQIGICEEVQR